MESFEENVYPWMVWLEAEEYGLFGIIAPFKDM